MQAILVFVGMTPTSVLSAEDEGNPQDASRAAALGTDNNKNSAFMATEGDARGLMEGLGDPIPEDGGKKGGKGDCGDAADGGGKGGKGMDSLRRNRRARMNRRSLSSGKRDGDGYEAIAEGDGVSAGLVVDVITCADPVGEVDGGS